MDAVGPKVPVPDLAWGMVAAAAGGMAVVWLTARGVGRVVHLVSSEVQQRLLEGGWATPRLTRKG